MAWELTGNTGTNPASNFLGTTDQRPVVIKTNNKEAVRVNPDGPASKVEIAAADGLAVTGDRPFITLRDANAGNAHSILQCLGGDMALIPNNPGGAIVAMVLKANTGNVGIGTLNPSSKVEIAAQASQDGVTGKGTTGKGVVGLSVSEHGVFGQSQSSRGVGGISVTDIGVFGVSTSGQGVRGQSESSIGTFGGSGTGIGVFGRSETGTGVIGQSNGDPAAGTAGVFGEHLANGTGVTGKSGNGFGVAGLSGLSNGVFGQSDFGIGVVGQSQCGIAVVGIGGFPEVVPSPDIFVGRSLEQGDVFRVRSTGDVQVRGVTLNCDKNVKANFSNVNTRQILERLSCMPIAEWSYKADSTSVHHIGPTSQDFKLAFGLNGDEDERISVVDAQGIALAAIQGLNEKLNAENMQLRANLVNLETRLAALESNLRTAGINAGDKGSRRPPTVT